MRANANVARFPGYAPAACEGGGALRNAARTVIGALKPFALFFAAPFVGLAYAVAFPLVGAGALVWLAVRAATKRAAAA